MQSKNKRKFPPWLTPTGVEIPTRELREIAKSSWSRATWEEYLKWYETSGREKILKPAIYEKLGDEQTESIFDQFAQDSSQENRDLCDRELSKLPLLEATVLRKYFVEGRTEVEIAFALHRSRTGISHIKNRALARLKRGNSGDNLSLCHFMRGECSSLPDQEPSIWDEPLLRPLKEDRPYSPDDHKTEFDQIKTSSIRAALLGLTDNAQKILYLRYWCGFSISQVARRLGRGANIIEQIESASISKVKRAALEFEFGTTLGGE